MAARTMSPQQNRPFGSETAPYPPKTAAHQTFYTPWPMKASIFVQILDHASDLVDMAGKMVLTASAVAA